MLGWQIKYLFICNGEASPTILSCYANIIYSNVKKLIVQMSI